MAAGWHDGLGNCSHGYLATPHRENEMGVVVPDSAIEGQEPFVWLPKGLTEGALGEVVGQSVGAASVCWVGGTGDREFDSTRASAIVDGLMAYLSDYMQVVRSDANQNTAAKMAQGLEANLGLATTQQMLEELAARFRELPNALGSVGWLLEGLSEKHLNYRTVDSK